MKSRDWSRILLPYRKPIAHKAILELLVTIGPFAVLWTATILALRSELTWLYALLLVPTAGFLVRLFMIQHDCGHASFFPMQRANDWTGRFIGVLTLTAYDDWRRSHAIHHANNGHLDRRGVGDIDTLTVVEYKALPARRRLLYRLYRHPIVMFGLGPAYLFLLQNRLPSPVNRKMRYPWLSTMSTNLGALALTGALMLVFGIVPVLMVHLPVVLIAATMGVWLFYVQHQFEDTHWAPQATWNADAAALQGSSHYDLPQPLRWLTANIGIHHVHHLSSRIPFYRLPEVLRDHPELKDAGRLTLWESFRCVRLTLWDEARQKLVTFREARAGT